MIRELYCFDFDKTLCLTPEPKEGKVIWKEKTGEDWGHRGWWGKPDSLDTSVFDIPKVDWIYEEYLRAVARPGSYVIMATGRQNRVMGMRSRVEEIIRSHNMSFDEVHLCSGHDTFTFKVKLFENQIENTKCEHFTMYDDRAEHLEKFARWGETQKIKITIIDSINKTIKTFN